MKTLYKKYCGKSVSVKCLVLLFFLPTFLLSQVTDTEKNSSVLFTDQTTAALQNDEVFFQKTEFISFTVRVSGRDVLLRWTTSKENESLIFKIERSRNGKNYTSLVSLQGNNNPFAETNEYSYTDANMTGELAWYRIRMVTNDKEHSFSQAVQVTNIRQPVVLHSLINPFNEELRFDLLSDMASPVQVELFNQFGTLIKRNSFTINKGLNNLTLNDTGNLSPGIYTLHIISGNITITRKVMKQNFR